MYFRKGEFCYSKCASNGLQNITRNRKLWNKTLSFKEDREKKVKVHVLHFCIMKTSWEIQLERTSVVMLKSTLETSSHLTCGQWKVSTL